MLSRSMSVLTAAVVAAACSGKAKDPTTTTSSSAGSSEPSGGDEGGGEAQPECEPGRCLPDISKAVIEKRPEARKCYDEGRKRDKTLQGLLIINFSIDPEGKVIETSQGIQDNQITEQGVVDCVSEVIKAITFGKSSKGKTTRAYHRFEFTPP